MPMESQQSTTEFIDIKPSTIIFKEKLSSPKHSEIFLVSIRGRTCVVKVRHDTGPNPWANPDREHNIFVCESRAYRRLKAHGLCDRSIVPQFYGIIEKIDPRDYYSHLKKFLNDEYSPNAILLEYIRNMERLDALSNVTKKRIENFITGIREIHKAMIEHSDIYPKNTIILRDHLDGRVIWLDFDQAQTFDQETLTEEQKEWIEFEEHCVIEMGSDMVSYNAYFYL
ncbi:hypothetical protein VTN00DRAFT_3406 [Thermoascus crustaceus]|uniref:uncharacterized protein n=1 Tax=Thermoascus crustaceus TaxID=5088 RepID=UPI003742DB42